MSDTATLDAAEITTSTDRIPGSDAEMPEGLRNLLDRVLPTGEDSGETEIPDKPSPETKPEPETKPAPVEKKSEAKHTEIRVAPDFSTQKKTEPQPEPEKDHAVALAELDTAIAGAKTEKQRVDLGKFRELLKTTISENATLKAKVAVPPAEDAGTKELLEKLQGENKVLTERIERVDLLASPKFQRDFVQPRNKLFGDAVALLKEAGADPEALERAMGLSGKARIGVLDELTRSIESQVLRDRFGRLVDGIEDKNREIGEALKHARTNNEQMTRAEKISQHEAIVKQEGELKTMLAMARRDLAENAKLPVLQKTNSKDFEWWDKQVDEIDSLAEHFMLRATPEMLPKIAYGAAMVDPLLDMFNAERRKSAALEKRLAAIEGADPGLGEDKRKPKDTGDVPEDADIKTAVFARLKSGR